MDQFNSWYNRFTRAWFLIGGHACVDLRAMSTVQCQTCHQTYDAYENGGSGIQGHDICAESRWSEGRWIIVCGYGSDFDLMEFWYIRCFPTMPVIGICDWCIRRMLRDGIIMDSGKEPTL